MLNVTTQQNYLQANAYLNENFHTNNSKYSDIYWEFSNFYRHIHGWLSTIVCIFGIASNLLIIIILSRPNMVDFIFLIKAVM